MENAPAEPAPAPILRPIAENMPVPDDDDELGDAVDMGLSFMNHPGTAPLMDLSVPHTDAEAQAYGFPSATEWKDRTLAAQSLGLDSITVLCYINIRIDYRNTNILE